MKQTKSFMFVFWGIFFALCFVIIVSLAGFFRAAEYSSQSTLTESKAVALLSQLYSQIKTAKNSDDFNRIFKSFSQFSGFSKGSEEFNLVEKQYEPAAKILAQLPQKVEMSVLEKKRDLMESLVNAYRKEVPSGDIRIRAGILNILFDTQNSLLNDSDESEKVYIEKTKDRFLQLKSVASSLRDAAQIGRISSLDSIFTSQMQAFSLVSSSQAKYQAALSDIEKNNKNIAKQLRLADEESLASTRRSFLYISLLALIVGAVSIVAVVLSQKFSRLRFESLRDAFKVYIGEYGKESAHDLTALSILKADEDWNSILKIALDSEQEFKSIHQGLLAVPRSINLPYVIFSKDSEVVHWNISAAKFFNFDQQKRLQDFFNETTLQARDGEVNSIISMIEMCMTSMRQDTFEIMLKYGDKFIPVELILSPITSGNLVGGKLFVIREIPNEIARLEKGVSQQLLKVRDFIYKITHGQDIQILANESDLVPIRETLMELGNLKLQFNEKQTLWSSEAVALSEQVTRQKDILQKMGAELNSIRDKNQALVQLIKILNESDEGWHEEVCFIERDLRRWIENRELLFHQLGAHDSILGRVSSIEKSTREAVAHIGNTIKEFEQKIILLKNEQFEARVQAVNLSFTEDPKQKESAAKFRQFTMHMDIYLQNIQSIISDLKDFIAKHPAGSFFPQLENAPIDQGLLDSLREEQSQWSKYIQRWKESGSELISGGGKAILIAEDIEKQNTIIAQLSDTSLLINEQAGHNIERWQ